MQALSIVPYYDVDRELHELKHRGELVPTRNEVMGKIGASILLSYSGLVVSYVTRKGLGFVRVLHSRDISDQELISCLHDQPRSCAFTTGDSLFVYTQYNETEQHILWFDIYNILYIDLCD